MILVLGRPATLPVACADGAMAEVVEGTAKLTDADRRAIALYVKSVPAPHSSGALCS